ncbi:uncharacterized protein KY384_003122 [Bacidia gigantensis]|uniref:uncharacterized protein n=1 Tax=Bacidia gigantensis TaxID=2732470 RepID=UPI001D0549B5|nr:uncharacterized protein KY384_003122 [Bacidia gigantensis]KAG8531493.1 hypothetical protein KY384_003122 [Bacidia gigantensis]
MPHSIASSVSSLGSPRRSHSEFSKPYKQASNFFLTRRFPEALSTIKPLVTAPQAVGEEHGSSIMLAKAPVAHADSRWRVKIWSLYLTLINAIVELGLEEGKNTLGKQQWKSIVAQTEDGSIWQEVVDIGYAGSEANVDPEVVVNLANLLLAQSQTQKANQDRLESYLSTSSSPDAGHRDGFESNGKRNGIVRSNLHQKDSQDPLHALEVRIQIIELFALHVLPRNDEWQYAKGFVTKSDILDEERKDVFLQTLNDLEEVDPDEREHFEDALPEHERVPQNGAISSLIGRTDSNMTIKPDPPRAQHITDTVRDHGSTESVPVAAEPELKHVPPEPAAEPAAPLPRKSPMTPQHRPLGNPTGKGRRGKAQPTVLERSQAVITTIHKVISNMAIQFTLKPMPLTRFLLFIIAFIAAFSRRDVREQLRRLTGKGWDKMRQTVGMGVKVSYI